MGEITDMILEGILCEECGCYIKSEPPDHPRKCEDCSTSEDTICDCNEWRCDMCFNGEVS